jgi:hypothetical protein
VQPRDHHTRPTRKIGPVLPQRSVRRLIVFPDA